MSVKSTQDKLTLTHSPYILECHVSSVSKEDAYTLQRSFAYGQVKGCLSKAKWVLRVKNTKSFAFSLLSVSITLFLNTQR